MNRRDLFRGAGALALTAAMPASPVTDIVWDDNPVVVGDIRDLMTRAMLNAPWFIAYKREFENDLLHGSPEREELAFTGLSPRYADLPPGDDTSIWLVSWGPDSVSYSPNIYEHQPRRVRTGKPTVSFRR